MGPQCRLSKVYRLYSTVTLQTFLLAWLRSELSTASATSPEAYFFFLLLVRLYVLLLCLSLPMSGLVVGRSSMRGTTGMVILGLSCHVQAIRVQPRHSTNKK